VVLFNLAQFQLTLDNPKQLILENRSHYLYLEYTSQRAELIWTFQRIFLSDKELL
jgi:hypothetical protein